jgi:hypothetical protein
LPSVPAPLIIPPCVRPGSPGGILPSI